MENAEFQSGIVARTRDGNRDQRTGPALTEKRINSFQENDFLPVTNCESLASMRNSPVKSRSSPRNL